VYWALFNESAGSSNPADLLDSFRQSIFETGPEGPALED